MRQIARWFMSTFHENSEDRPSGQEACRICINGTRRSLRVAALFVIVPIFVEPTFKNAVAVVAGVGLALAFAFKDYGSSIVAGHVTVLENNYQPGDWIELGGVYGRSSRSNCERRAS